MANSPDKQQELREIVENPLQPKKAPRGRTHIKGGDERTPSPTKPMIEQVERAESNRPVTGGTGRHRGDRRDTSPTYTGNEKHSARGSNPRKDVKTRKR